MAANEIDVKPNVRFFAFIIRLTTACRGVEDGCFDRTAVNGRLAPEKPDVLGEETLTIRGNRTHMVDGGGNSENLTVYDEFAND